MFKKSHSGGWAENLEYCNLFHPGQDLIRNNFTVELQSGKRTDVAINAISACRQPEKLIKMWRVAKQLLSDQMSLLPTAATGDPVDVEESTTCTSSTNKKLVSSGPRASSVHAYRRANHQH